MTVIDLQQTSCTENSAAAPGDYSSCAWVNLYVQHAILEFFICQTVKSKGKTRG